MLLLCWTLAFRAALVASTAIDNGVEEIMVDCTDNGVGIRIELLKPMITGGRMFVKGRSFEQGCYAPMVDDATAQAFGVSFGQCGMERTGVTGVGSVWGGFEKDKGEVSYMVTIIASMHPIFITKVDRAYNVLCTYARKTQDSTLTQMIDVSMLPTTEVTREFPRVKCEYRVHLNSSNGPVVRYAAVGQPLFHVWECDGLTETQYILIRNCFSRDDEGRISVETVDGDGCPRDPVAVMDPIYEKNRIVAMSHAYKFPDKTFVAFECQISICDDCGAPVPPVCPMLPPGHIQNNPKIGLQQTEVPGTGPNPGIETNKTDLLGDRNETSFLANTDPLAGLLPTLERNDSVSNENDTNPLRWPTEVATLPGPIRRAKQKRAAPAITFDVASKMDVLDELEEDPAKYAYARRREPRNPLPSDNVCMGTATVALLATAVGIVCIAAVFAAWILARRPKSY